MYNKAHFTSFETAENRRRVDSGCVDVTSGSGLRLPIKSTIASPISNHLAGALFTTLFTFMRGHFLVALSADHLACSLIDSIVDRRCFYLRIPRFFCTTFLFLEISFVGNNISYHDSKYLI